MTPQLAEVGQFCPNDECEFYQDLKSASIIRYGKTAKGTQRFMCNHCGKTSVETTGTLFYGKHTPRKEILEALAMSAERMRISSISRVKVFKEDTILDWLREAAEHAEQMEAVLMHTYEVTQAQIDGLWAYVGHKGKRGILRKRRRRRILALHVDRDEYLFARWAWAGHARTVRNGPADGGARGNGPFHVHAEARAERHPAPHAIACPTTNRGSGGGSGGR